MCSLIEKNVEKMCVSSNNSNNAPIEFVTTSTRLENKQVISSCQNAAKITQNYNEENKQQGITHRVSLRIFSIYKVFYDN